MQEKLNSWSKKRFFVTIMFATATFAACFAAGGGISAAFGSGMSGIVTIIITTVLVVVGANIVRTPGYFTLTVTWFCVLAIPTALFGPPGPHKIAVGFATGLVYDVVWNVLRRGKYSLPIAAASSTATSVVLIYLLLSFFFPDHPKLKTLASLLKYLIPLYAVLGYWGACLGNWIYRNNISNLPYTKMLLRDD